MSENAKMSCMADGLLQCVLVLSLNTEECVSVCLRVYVVCVWVLL